MTDNSTFRGVAGGFKTLSPAPDLVGSAPPLYLTHPLWDLDLPLPVSIPAGDVEIEPGVR